jgi:hypothetical protein
MNVAGIGRRHALVLLGLFTACAPGTAKQLCMSVGSVGPLVRGAALFRLDVYGAQARCSGASVAPGAGPPTLSRTYGANDPISFEVPPGAHALVLTTFADAQASMPLGRGCVAANVSPGAQVCFNLTVAPLGAPIPSDMASDLASDMPSDLASDMAPSTASDMALGTSCDGSCSAPSLTVSKNPYAVGEPLVFTFKNGPGNATDWVGVYPGGTTPITNDPILWDYIGGGHSATIAASSGTVALANGSENVGHSWPLPVGHYTGFFLINDGYNWIASVDFDVR